MEPKTIVFAVYEQEGHPSYPEDTWEIKRPISTTKELYWFMKDMYKSSARSFSDYPFGGLFGFGNISFSVQYTITFEGRIYKTEMETTVNPIFYNEAKQMFTEWKNFIDKRIPGLRRAREKREKEEKERLQYELLKYKYQ